MIVFNTMIESAQGDRIEQIARKEMTSRAQVVRDALDIYFLVREVIAEEDLRAQEAELRKAKEAEARQPEPAPAPRYDSARPTEEDIEATYQALRPIWTSVKYIADKTGLESYVVRRACKALEGRDEAVSKEFHDSIQYMRRPRAVQQTLPEPKKNCTNTGIVDRVKACLKSGTWRTTAQVGRALKLSEDSEEDQRSLYNALSYLARKGEIEKYPPFVPGRRTRVAKVEWRLKPKEANQ